MARDAADDGRSDITSVQHALDLAEAEMDGLHTAMRSRAIIEQAKGMLMFQRKIDADAAFALLVQLSQTTGRKLIDVAVLLVESWRVPADNPP